MAGRPTGSVNKRSSQAAEAFSPHVDDALRTLKEIRDRTAKRFAKGSGRETVSTLAVNPEASFTLPLSVRTQAEVEFSHP